jgi:sec-independent protein translocase protein TatA
MEGLLSPVHLVIIMVIVLILFGPGKLPDLGKGLGKGIREFKEAIRGGADGDADKK